MTWMLDCAQHCPCVQGEPWPSLFVGHELDAMAQEQERQRLMLERFQNEVCPCWNHCITTPLVGLCCLLFAKITTLAAGCTGGARAQQLRAQHVGCSSTHPALMLTMMHGSNPRVTCNVC
jgi:hypothetical protein